MGVCSSSSRHPPLLSSPALGAPRSVFRWQKVRHLMHNIKLLLRNPGKERRAVRVVQELFGYLHYHSEAWVSSEFHRKYFRTFSDRISRKLGHLPAADHRPLSVFLDQFWLKVSLVERD